jgi:putative CocE/NonD family hydrolase
MRFVDVSRVRSQFHQRVTVSDGANLSADVYRPAAPGLYPLLVTTTPYDNNHADATPPMSTAPQVPSDRFKLLAAHGFVVVAGDARGRGDSEGTFAPFRNEASDGADLVTWAKGLTEVDGRVGLFGTGYSGFAALATATATTVDAVVAWSPFGGAEGLPARGGALRLEWLLWMHLVGGRVRGPVDVPVWDEIHRVHPLAAMHLALGRPDAEWPIWLEHLDPRDPYWSVLDLDALLAGHKAPTLLVSGWWDTNLEATSRHWRAMAARGGAGHELVVGPWDTSRTRRPSSEVGGVDWGPAAAVEPEQILIDWFRKHLDSEHVVEESVVRVFVTGRNAWAHACEWPPASDVEIWWLTSEGRANTRVGDGVLAAAWPSSDHIDDFIHDPADPVPWQRHVTSFSRNNVTFFDLGSAHATSRDDTLCYTSAPATSPRTYAGRPRVHLVTETDLDDADWFVILEDVFPGGTRSVALSHGAVRAGTRPDFVPGRPTTFSIPMTEVAHEVQPGHALRLVVSSSLFPLYAINPGGTSYVHSSSSRRGRHRVHHGPAQMSSLELPLVRSRF